MSQVSDIIVSWTPDTSPAIAAAQIRSRIVGTADWTEQAASADATAGTFRFTSNAPNTDVEVQLRYRMVNGTVSPWVDMTVHTAGVTVPYTAVSGTPTSLEQINGTEGDKLTGIAPGATVGSTLGTNFTDTTGKIFDPRQIVTLQGTSADTSAVNGVPSATVINNIATNTSAITATNATIATTNATVATVQAGAATALTNAESTLNAAIAAGDANLQTQVTNLGTTVGQNSTAITTNLATLTNSDTAIGQRIDAVNVTLGQNTSNITSNQTALATTNSTVAVLSSTIQSSYAGAGNLLTNTNFVTTDGWTFQNNFSQPGVQAGINIAGDSWHPIGENSISLFDGNGQFSNAAAYVHWVSTPVSVTPGQYIQVYAYCASHRSQTEVALTFLDSSGNGPTYYESGYQGGLGPTDANGGNTLAQYRQQGFSSVQVPVNAAQVIVFLRKGVTNTSANPSNSYAWFCRPYVGQARAGQTQWNPYAQGSATANQTAVNATISNNFTTLTNADTAAATQTVALQATAQQGGCYNTDPTFQVQTIGGFPNYWNNYDAGPTGANFLSKVAGRNGVGNAIRVACPQGQSSYFAQAISPTVAAGTWVVVEADFTLNAGALNASGVYLGGAQGIGFAGERDASGGNMGNGTVGKFYQMRKLCQVGGNGMVALYPMTHWASLGDVSANQADITWYRLAVRPATQIEIDSQNVVSTSLPSLTTRVTSAESAIVANNQAIATRTTTLEASTLQSTTYLNRNANFSNWPGAANSPPALSDGSGLDYMSRVSGIVGTYGLNYSVPANYGRDFFMAFDGQNGLAYDPGILNLSAGYYFLEADVTLNSGSLATSGCYAAIYGSSGTVANSIDFYSTPDSSGNPPGDGVPGTRYKYSFMFDYRAAGPNGRARIHPMPVWSGFGKGNNTAKNITFNSVGIRTASSQEIAGIGRDARLTTNEGAITGLNGKTTAYWQTTAVAGNNRAQLTIHADANGGAGVDIVGDVSISGTAVIGKSGGGGNMVQNPSSMDGTVKGWQQYEGDGQGDLTSNQGFYSVGRTGFNFGKNNGTGGGTSYVTPAMPVTPGKTYVVSATIGASASCSTGLYFRVIYSQARPASGYIGNRDGYTDFIANGPNGNGGKYEYVWTCPSGMNFAAIAIYNWTNHAQTLYFGDVIFIEQASSVQIQDGAITADKLTIGSTSGARTTIAPNLISVYDGNNMLRVRLGVF